MTKNAFVAIHQLVGYAGGAPLNRGGDGLPKTITVGGIERTRISAQSGKKALREADMESLARSLKLQMSVRSTEVFSTELRKLLDEAQVPEAQAWAAACARVFTGGATKSEKANAKKGKKAPEVPEDEAPEVEADGDTVAVTDDGKLGQVLVLGRGELEIMGQAVKDLMALGFTPENLGTTIKATGKASEEEKRAAKEKEKARSDVLERIKKASDPSLAGLDGALFGRMATSDLLTRCDACVKVGEAIGTGPHQLVADFFSAVDALTSGSGAGHVNTKPVNGGIFYRHTVVDLERLERNFPTLSLEQRADLVAWLVQALWRVGLTRRLSGAVGEQTPIDLIVEVTASNPLSAMYAFEKVAETRDAARSQLAAELESQALLTGKPPYRKSVFHVATEETPGIEALAAGVHDFLTAPRTA